MTQEFTELLLPDSATTDIFQYTPEAWGEIGSTLADIDMRAFTNHGSESLSDWKNWMETLFKNPDRFTILLKSKEGKLIGYSQAEQMQSKRIAKIHRTAIAPEKQGLGLIQTLMDRMEKELKDRGVTRLEREARIDNGYANSIRKHYGNRITYDKPSLTVAPIGSYQSFIIKI